MDVGCTTAVAIPLLPFLKSSLELPHMRRRALWRWQATAHGLMVWQADGRGLRQVLRRLVAELGDAGATAQMRQFLMERCAGAVCLGSLAGGGLDARDAAVSALLTELAGLLLDCAGRCQGELPAFLRARVLPQLGISAALRVCSNSACLSPDGGSAGRFSDAAAAGKSACVRHCSPGMCTLLVLVAKVL